MPIIRKKTARKPLKKRKSSTVVVIVREIAPEDTLFPEKVANANKMLSKVKNRDARFGPIDLD